MAYAVQATTHYQTYPERRPGADLPPKKACNLDPMAPVPVKNVNFSRAPGIVIAVSSDPILPHR